MHDTYSATLRVHEIFARTEVLYTNEYMLDISKYGADIGTLDAKHDLIGPSSGLLLGFYHLNMSCVVKTSFHSFHDICSFHSLLYPTSIHQCIDEHDRTREQTQYMASGTLFRKQTIFEMGLCILFLFMCFFTHRRLL